MGNPYRPDLGPAQSEDLPNNRHVKLVPSAPYCDV